MKNIYIRPKGSVKPHARPVKAALKLIFNQSGHYNFKAQYFLVLRPLPQLRIIINTIIKVNLEIKAITISTYCFSTLHTFIPHNSLKSVMGKLIDFFFDSGVKEFPAVTKYGTTCTNNQ